MCTSEPARLAAPCQQAACALQHALWLTACALQALKVRQGTSIPMWRAILIMLRYRAPLLTVQQAVHAYGLNLAAHAQLSYVPAEQTAGSACVKAEIGWLPVHTLAPYACAAGLRRADSYAC